MQAREALRSAVVTIQYMLYGTEEAEECRQMNEAKGLRDEAIFKHGSQSAQVLPTFVEPTF
jgi:hypothetical protein